MSISEWGLPPPLYSSPSFKSHCKGDNRLGICFILNLYRICLRPAFLSSTAPSFLLSFQKVERGLREKFKVSPPSYVPQQTDTRNHDNLFHSDRHYLRMVHPESDCRTRRWAGSVRSLKVMGQLLSFWDWVLTLTPNLCVSPIFVQCIPYNIPIGLS